MLSARAKLAGLGARGPFGSGGLLLIGCIFGRAPLGAAVPALAPIGVPPSPSLVAVTSGCSGTFTVAFPTTSALATVAALARTALGATALTVPLASPAAAEVGRSGASTAIGWADQLDALGGGLAAAGLGRKHLGDEDAVDFEVGIDTQHIALAGT